MRFLLIILFTSVTNFLFSQERKDIGFLAGTSYYMGDFNQGEQFYQPSPLGSIMGRYNFNSFFSLRASITYGRLKGSHDINSFFLPGNPTPFSKQLITLGLDSEINFFPFDSRKSFKQDFSPYLILGLGVAYEGTTILPHFPAGIGIKYSPIGRITIGAEWRLHKTFYDLIDDYSNITNKRKSFIHNNDWFGIAGLFVTYRLYNTSALCPAYR